MGVACPFAQLAHAAPNAVAATAEATGARHLKLVRAPRVVAPGARAQAVPRAAAALVGAPERLEVAAARRPRLGVYPVIRVKARRPARRAAHHRPRQGPGPVVLVARHGVVKLAPVVAALPAPGVAGAAAARGASSSRRVPGAVPYAVRRATRAAGGPGRAAPP